MRKQIAFVILTTFFFLGKAGAQKWGNTPEDSILCIKNLSLYQEFYKQQAYTDAYEPWHNAIKVCPCNGKNLYIRGVNIMKHQIEHTKDLKLQNQYIDELLNMYDKRILCFGEEAEIKGKKAIDMRTYRKDIASKAYFELFNEVYQLDKEKMDIVYAYYYFVSAIEYVEKQGGDPTIIIETYDKVSTILNLALAKNDENKATVEAYIANVEAGLSPYASCDQLIQLFQQKFNQTPNDLDLLKKITSILESKKCTSNELFYKATENLHAKEPNARTAYLMGRFYTEKNQFSKAIQFLKEATDKFESPNDLYYAYMALANAYYNANQYGEARSAAYQAANSDKSKGDPYLFIAQLYVQSASSCCGDGVYRRVAYWAATDKVLKAKAVDPSLSDQANRLVNTYSAYYPEQSDAFMNGLEDGNSFTVGGWIQERTTVRTRK